MRLLLFILGISVVISALKIAPRPKTILGARFTVGWVARIAGSQRLNNAWKPRKVSAAYANRIRGTFLHPDHVRRVEFIDVIRIS